MKQPVYKDVIFYYNQENFENRSIQQVIKNFYEKNNIDIKKYPELANEITKYIFEYIDAFKVVKVDSLCKVIYHEHPYSDSDSILITDCYLLCVFNPEFNLPWAYQGFL